jgi:DNA-binding protein YbaB
MRMDYDETMQGALAELRQKQARLREMRERASETQTKVRSADGMVTVVVDGRGELTSITFNTAKWRRMAPAELSALLVQTITKARADSRNEMLRNYHEFMPKGLLPRSADGQLNFDQMFEDAIKKATTMLSGEFPEPGALPPRS